MTDQNKAAALAAGGVKHCSTHNSSTTSAPGTKHFIPYIDDDLSGTTETSPLSDIAAWKASRPSTLLPVKRLDGGVP
jgi:hypothetical protein